MTLQSRYSILRKIADGGTAEIFLAKQHGAQGFEKTVVLKRIFASFYADPQFRHMLVDEAHIAMSLNHSSIVQVLDLGEVEGRYFLALELVDGWTLDRTLKRAQAAGVPFAPALALYVTAEVCRALGYAHAKSRDGKPLHIVHRDVSPHNVLLSAEGECKLTDFGIAKAQNRKEKSLGNMIKGKISFMSPEQASGGEIDARSDLFSLGTMLYAMITRRLPFDAPTDYETLMLVKAGDFLPPETARPGLNPELYRVIRKAMSKSPDDRYQKAEEMLVDVEQVMRLAFRPVGQTELQRWLLDLSAKDGVPPLTRDMSLGVAAAPAVVAPPAAPPAKPPVPAAKIAGLPPPKRASGGTDAGQESGLVLDLADAIEVSPSGPTKPPAPPIAAPTEPMLTLPDMSGGPAPEEDVDLRVKPWYRRRAGVMVGAIALLLLFVAAVKGFSDGRHHDAGGATVAAETKAPAPAAAPIPEPVPPPVEPVPAPAAPTPTAAPAAPAPEPASAPAVPPPASAEAPQPAEKAAPPPVAAAAPEPAPQPEADEPKEEPREDAEAAAKTRKPTTVAVTFKTEPAGARVATSKKTYGTTPQSVKLPPGSTYDLTFTKAGYETATKHYVVPTTPKGAQTVRVTLKKTAEPPKKASEPPKKTVEARTPPAQPVQRKGWFSR